MINIKSLIEKLKIDFGRNKNNSGTLVEKHDKNVLNVKGNLTINNVGISEEEFFTCAHSWNKNIENLQKELDLQKAQEFELSSPKHMKDIQDFLLSGLSSNQDIAKFIASKIDMISSKEQNLRMIVLDAEYFILNASEFEKSFLVWTFYYQLITSNLTKVDLLVEKANLIRKFFPLSTNKCLPSDLPVFMKIGANVTKNLKNISLDESFAKNPIEKEAINKAKKMIPEINVTYEKKLNFLVGLDNCAAALTRSLRIAAEYFIEYVCGVKLIRSN